MVWTTICYSKQHVHIQAFILPAPNEIKFERALTCQAKNWPRVGQLGERLIKDQKFTSRNTKEVKLITEVLEADTLREAQEAAYQQLKLLYIANTKGWAVAAHYQEDLEAAFGILTIDDQPVSNPRVQQRDKRSGHKAQGGHKAALPWGGFGCQSGSSRLALATPHIYASPKTQGLHDPKRTGTVGWVFSQLDVGAPMTRGSGSPWMILQAVLSQTPLSWWCLWTSRGQAACWTWTTRALNFQQAALRCCPHASLLDPLRMAVTNSRVTASWSWTLWKEWTCDLPGALVSQELFLLLL